MGSAVLVETYPQLPITLTRGDGTRVRDVNGREYWDLYGGHAVALLGHAHAAVTRAVAEQCARLTFYSNVMPLEIRTRAATALAAFAPAELGHVFFCNSGAEANENALKLAVQQSGRTRIAALDGAFHGRTLLALAATTGESMRAPLKELLAPNLHLPPNAVDALTQIDESIAAVIVEPIQSMAGVVELSADYLRALRARCTEVGALLIYDEVQTGFGRLGRPFAAGEFGVLPDMATLAKGIANGIPMGAVLLSDAVAERVRVNDLGTTFGGGPVPCAALLAVLETIEREGLVARAGVLGGLMRSRLAVGPVQRVIGRGCLIGLVCATPAKPLRDALLARGFITGVSGDPHVLRLLPPINMPSEAIEALREALLAIKEDAHAALA